MKILETDRTILREITEDDAAFVLDLLNQPSFIKYIGDRNVRDLEQAREYVESRFTFNYKKFNFGMWLVELKETGEPIGMCGFVKRDSLPEADIGFAFLPQFERKGFGFETADAVLKFGRDSLNLKRILAIVSQDNQSSEKLLLKVGFAFERLIEISGEELKLFSSNVRENFSLLLIL